MKTIYLLFFLLILFSFLPVSASSKTIDADGSADYSNLDAALRDIVTGSISDDTLLFIGDDQDTYNWTRVINDRQNYGKLVIRSNQTDPDLFPVIIKNCSASWDFFRTIDTFSIENCIFESGINGSENFIWTNAQSVNNYYHVKNCVFRTHQGNDYIFKFTGSNATEIVIENCLFEGNSRVFEFEYWNSDPTISITNCTFDLNDTIFKLSQYPNNPSNLSITNCIFGDNGFLFPGGTNGETFKSVTTHTLTSETTTGYGSDCVSGLADFVTPSSRSVPTDWMIPLSSPAHNMGTDSDYPPLDISGYDRISHADAGCFEVHVYDFAYDVDYSTDGIQSGDGAWTGNRQWTYDNGVTNTNWRGIGNSALFSGAPGTFTVTLGATEYVDSITFSTSEYTITGETIVFSSNNTIIVEDGQQATIASVIDGTIGLYKKGNGTLSLTSENTFTGITTISGGTLAVTSIDDGGNSCGIGSETTAASNLVIDNGILRYNGASTSTDRLFTIGENGATIDASGTGPLNFSSATPLPVSGSGSRTLTLTGSNTGDNTFTPVIENDVDFTKSGNGTWLLASMCTYSGATNITGGTLVVNGEIPSGNEMTVQSDATLAGNGIIGAETVIYGNLSPGYNSEETVTFEDNVSFSSSASMIIEISALDDFDNITVSGTVTLENAELSSRLEYTPDIGDSFIIIDNDGTDAIDGIFDGLPDGSRVILSFNAVSYYITITYAGGDGNDVELTVTSIATDYFWDTSTDAGFQPDNGSWGNDAFWSADGVTLTAWRGSGNSATFTGGAGEYEISVADTQHVDSIAFLSGTYTLTGGTIDFGSKNGLLISDEETVVIGSTIDGEEGLIKHGAGTLILNGTNLFTGSIENENGILQIGAGGNSGSVGSDIENNATLVIDRTGTFSYNSVISGTGDFRKSGSGILRFSEDQRFTGVTSVAEGTLVINGVFPSTSVTIDSGAQLSGEGSCSGPVISEGGILSPGDDAVGTFSTAGLTLTAESQLTFELGGVCDSLIIDGDLLLDGTLNIIAAAGFSSGSFEVISVTGDITDDTISFGTVPAGKEYSLSISSGGISIICSTAIITEQPENTSVIRDESALFSVTAIGEGTIGYTWMKETDDDSVYSTVSTLSFSSVSLADTGNYRCIVTDSFGIDTSAWATLAIVDPPTVTTQPPETLTVTVTHDVQMSIEASGTEPLYYEWHKVEDDDAVRIDSSATGAYTLSEAAFSDSGYYYCKVGNAGGATNSDTLFLQVEHIPPEIIENPDDTAAKVEDTLVVSVKATGNATPAFSWFKTGSDSIISDSSVLLFAPLIFDDSGSYYCIASNPAGSARSDTFTISVEHIPPTITSQPVSDDVRVGESVTFSVTTDGNAEPDISWFKIGTDASISDERSYSIESVEFSDSGRYYCIAENPGGSDYSDTVTLSVSHKRPEAALSFSPDNGKAPLEVTFIDLSEGVITDRRWDFGDGTTSEKKNPTHVYTTNGLYPVTLYIEGPGGKDTLRLDDTLYVYLDNQNPVRLIARYLKDRDVEITLLHTDQIDFTEPEPVADSLGIWIGNGGIPEDEDDGTFTIAYYKDQLEQDRFIDTLTIPGNDSLIGLMSALFWNDESVSAFQRANGTQLLMREIIIPENTLQISSEAVTSTRVRLTWTNTVPEVATSLRVWYGTSEITAETSEPDGDEFHSVVLDAEESSFLVTDLSPETEYYFAIQVGHNEYWSDFTENAITRCTTLDSNATINYVNTAIIKSLSYDSSAAAIRISWCIDEQQLQEDVEIGINYGFDNYPVTHDAVSMITLIDDCMDTIVPLHEPLLFNTLYHVALWMRTRDGTWLEPVKESRSTVTTGKPFRQTISFFDTTARDDTVYAFNGSVLLWKDSTYTDNTILVDTLQVVAFEDVPEGFIPVGTPFFFRKGEPVLPFHIGFHLTSLPENFSIDDVRIFSVKNGSIRVYHDFSIDEENSIISVITDDLKRDFIAMIDTIPPRVTVLSDTSHVVYSSRSIKDTVEIEDNVENVSWKFAYSRGNEYPDTKKRGELDKNHDTIAVKISSKEKVISSESGLCALFILSDGTFTDTVNISRSVFINESDKITTEENSWIPIYPTALPYSSDIKPFIHRLHEKYSEDNYDKRYLRLYRWISYAKNNKNDEKWVEYTDDSKIDALFSLAPGKIFWIKTRENKVVHFDSASTLSLKENFTVTLPPDEWIDFGMPFRYDVSVQDIIDATGTEADSILYFHWERNKSSGEYLLNPLYIATIPDKNDRSVTLRYGVKSGYCLYNKSAEKIILKIPPFPDAGNISSKKHAKKKKGTAWSVKFISRSENGVSYPPVYCGYAPGIVKGELPVSPTFSEVTTYLYDRASEHRSGHSISESGKTGLTKELILRNESKKNEKVSYSLGTTGAFPDNYKPLCYNPEDGSFDSSGTISVKAKSLASRLIIVGDADYRRRFIETHSLLRYSLHRIYPNPARSLVTFRYTVPLGAKERISFTVFNMLGKKIWEKNIHKLLTAGVHQFTWNGSGNNGSPVGSGLYIVRLSVTEDNGHLLRQFDRRLTFLR